MKSVRIFDINGRTLYESSPKSKKQFVEELVKNHQSLANADFEGFDLTHVNLDGGNFDGANFNGADIRGATAKNASFVGATFRGTLGMGFQAKLADFTRADFRPHPEYETPSRFDGIIAQYAKFNLAKFMKTSFRHGGLSSTTFCGASIQASDFSHSFLHNVDYSDAKIHKCIFHHADMTPTMKTVAEEHLPDRTHGAVIRNNKYWKTQIGRGNSLFKRDSLMSAMAPILYSSAAALSIAGVWTVVPEISLEQIREFVGNNTWSFIGVATAFVVAKDRLEDTFKEYCVDIAASVTDRVRSIFQALSARGKAVMNLSVAVMTGNVTKVLQKAMIEADIPFLKAIEANMTGQVDVIIADRDKLASALRRLSDAYSGRYASDQDLIIARAKDHVSNAHSPSAIVLRADGVIEALWPNADGGMIDRKWDRAGFDIENTDQKGAMQGPPVDHRKILKRFIDSIVLDNDVCNFDFDPNTHSVRSGEDNTIIVVNQKSARVDNPWGPSILTGDGKALYFKNAKRTDENFKPISSETELGTPLPRV